METKIKEGWKKFKLGILIDSISKTHNFSSEELIPINTSDVLNGKVLNHKSSKASEFKGQFKKSFQNGDFLYSEIRPINLHFARINFEAKNYVASTKLMVLRKISDEIESDFLYQILKAPFFIKNLQLMAESRSGTFPQITFSELANIEINLPPLPEQKKIAGILSSLDDKIEINNQMNSTLEKISQEIFKRWFVDFEFPNEKGEPYKSSGGLMVESELGEIPLGWKVGFFNEYISEIIGGDWGKEIPEGNFTEEIFCIRGADIVEATKGFFNNVPKRFILNKNFQNKKLKEGDLIVEISGGSPTQSTGRIGYINKIILDIFSGKLISTNFCRTIRPYAKENTNFIFYYWKYLYNGRTFFKFENGTTGLKNLDLNTFLESFSIIIPPKTLINKFSLIIESNHKIIQENGINTKSLSVTRDLLLPKLMSGEIEIKN
ncbi:MAG: restriction endonuclease subunit S [Fusobacteriaceae bacterium]